MVYKCNRMFLTTEGREDTVHHIKETILERAYLRFVEIWFLVLHISKT